MKAASIVIVCVLLVSFMVPCHVVARHRGFEAFYEKYKDRENFESFSLKPGLLRMFMSNDDKEAKQLMKHIKQFKMLVCDINPDSVKHFNNELNDLIHAGQYEDLLVVNDGTDHVTFKAHMKENKIIEVIMLARDSDSFTVLYVKGDIDMKDVKELTKSVTVKNK